MGILLMNIAAFALPMAAYANPRAFGANDALDYAVWAVEFVLVDGKMRTLFSMLFGASMLLVIQRAEAAGQDSQKVHFHRMGWLLLFGAAHFALIWYGDILTLYALMGMIAWFFAERSDRTLLRAAVLLLAVQLIAVAAMLFFIHQTAIAAAAPDASVDAIGSWAALNAEIGLPTRFDLMEQLDLHRGGYGAMVADRVAAATPIMALPMAALETLAYMLLGMVALRNGFFAGRWARAEYLRTAKIAYAVALPPTILLAFFCFAVDFAPVATFGASLVGALPVRPILAIGHAALALAWLTGPATPLKARVAAAGRAAFTNYLGTSLVMTTLFYGYGFGLFGRLDRTALLGVVALGCLAMLAWSKPWLDRFRYGPFEWLWRCLARGRIEPMRRIDIASRSQ